MIRSINQIIESVSHADSLFATLCGVTLHMDLRGRPRAIFNKDFIIVEVEHECRIKLLVCAATDDSQLRELYLEHSSSEATSWLTVELREGEMTLFDNRGTPSTASIMLVERAAKSESEPTTRLEKIIGEIPCKITNLTPRQIEREGVIFVQTPTEATYTTTDGQPLNTVKLLSGEPLREGCAEVEAESGRGLIDKSGAFVLEPHYEELVWDEMTGVCVAMRDGEWNMYDRNGVRLTRQGYEWIGEASDGLFPMVERGRCGFLASDGSEVIASEWDEASSFDERVARVVRDGMTYVIDNKGFVVK